MLQSVSPPFETPLLRSPRTGSRDEVHRGSPRSFPQLWKKMWKSPGFYRAPRGRSRCVAAFRGAKGGRGPFSGADPAIAQRHARIRTVSGRRKSAARPGSVNVNMTGSNVWEQVLSRIESKVNRHSFYTWFKPTLFVADRDGTVRVRVPNALFRDWLTKHYSVVIDEALVEVQRPDTTIAFVTDDAGAAPPISEAPAAVPDVEPEEN